MARRRQELRRTYLLDLPSVVPSSGLAKDGREERKKRILGTQNIRCSSHWLLGEQARQ